VRGRYRIGGGLSLEEKEGWVGEKFEDLFIIIFI